MDYAVCNKRIREIPVVKDIEYTLGKCDRDKIAFFLDGKRSTLFKVSDAMSKKGMTYMLDYVLDEAGRPCEIRCDRLM